MSRSYSWSLLIHLGLLTALLLGSILFKSKDVRSEESKVVMRPMELTRPKKPEMSAGSSAQLEANPVPNPEPRPISAEPEGESPPEVSESKPPPTASKPPKNLAPSERAAKPQFLISSPDYPTYQPNSIDEVAPGDERMNLRGETSLKDRPAIPYYHPAVTLEGVTGRDWILVRFEVEANGTFEVQMLEGTGNIHQDARVLNVLRRWRWLAMQIDGQTYRSVEVVRLYRRDIGRE